MGRTSTRGWAGRGSPRAWRRLRLAVLARDGHVCAIQGPRCLGLATTVDHVLRLADGGPLLDPANCRAACTTCNYGRRDHGPPASRSTVVETRTRW